MGMNPESSMVPLPGPLSEQQYRIDLEHFITSALDALEGFAVTNPSRELSLCKTKLEEAEMWFEKAPGTARRKP